MPYKLLNPDKPRGFTMIETLMYLALAVTGLVVLFYVHVASLNTNSLATAQQRLMESQRIINQLIKNKLDGAVSIETPASGTAAQLSITTPTVADNPTLFSWEADHLVLTVGNEPPLALNPANIEVVDFQVQRLVGTPTSIKVTFTLQTATATNAVISVTDTFTYVLRYEN